MFAPRQTFLKQLATVPNCGKLSNEDTRRKQFVHSNFFEELVKGNNNCLIIALIDAMIEATGYVDAVDASLLEGLLVSKQKTCGNEEFDTFVYSGMRGENIIPTLAGMLGCCIVVHTPNGKEMCYGDQRCLPLQIVMKPGHFEAVKLTD